MMMKIKNIGKVRLRLDRTLFIAPNEVMDVDYQLGSWAVKNHTAITKISTPKPKFVAPPRPVKKVETPKPIIKDKDKKETEVKVNDSK